MGVKHCKRIIDVLLAIGLLLLMSYQITGEAGHEWTGIGMTVLMVLHQIVNRKWYAALAKRKYPPLRLAQTLVNAALIICFVLTALCGINMSVHAVPFLAEFMRASLGRRLHLTLSHWCFVFMGLHLGLHVPAMLHGLKNQALRRGGFALSILAAGCGLWLFVKNSYPAYLFYQVPFAFIDYDKAAALVLLEALLIAAFWVFVGAQLSRLLNSKAPQQSRMAALAGVLLAVLLGLALLLAFPAVSNSGWGQDTGAWSASVAQSSTAAPGPEAPAPAESTLAPAAAAPTPAESTLAPATETPVPVDSTAAPAVEAEWEYACRAGTTTPFNTIHATGPEEANYYGHYPYEIEAWNPMILAEKPFCPSAPTAAGALAKA